VANGELKIVDLSIDPGIISAGDVKKIEKAVISAVNNVVEKMKRQSADEMSRIAGGLI